MHEQCINRYRHDHRSATLQPCHAAHRCAIPCSAVRGEWLQSYINDTQARDECHCALSRLLPSGNRFSPGALLALILIQVVFIALMFGWWVNWMPSMSCKHSSGAHSARGTVGQHHLLQCHCDDRREFLSSAKLIPPLILFGSLPSLSWRH